MGGERELIPVRRALVQLLRKAARTCDVELVLEFLSRNQKQRAKDCLAGEPPGSRTKW